MLLLDSSPTLGTLTVVSSTRGATSFIGWTTVIGKKIRLCVTVYKYVHGMAHRYSFIPYYAKYIIAIIVIIAYYTKYIQNRPQIEKYKTHHTKTIKHYRTRNVHTMYWSFKVKLSAAGPNIVLMAAYVKQRLFQTILSHTNLGWVRSCEHTYIKHRHAWYIKKQQKICHLQSMCRQNVRAVPTSSCTSRTTSPAFYWSRSSRLSSCQTCHLWKTVFCLCWPICLELITW